MDKLDKFKIPRFMFLGNIKKEQINCKYSIAVNGIFKNEHELRCKINKKLCKLCGSFKLDDDIKP